MHSSTIKNIGIAIGILGIIGGLILGGALKTTSVNSFGDTVSKFNVALMACSWVGAIFTTILFVILSTIVEHLEIQTRFLEKAYTKYLEEKK